MKWKQWLRKADPIGSAVPMKIPRNPSFIRPGVDFEAPLLRADLRLRLLDAIDWCVGRADPTRPRDCLRTPELQPYLFNANRYESVDDVALARHKLLQRTGVAETFPHSTGNLHESARRFPDNFSGGRLLTWYRDVTIDDGMGESLSDGYLDVSDMPPWDTWIAYASAEDDRRAEGGYLVSWVAEPFVSSVARAIDANAYDALFWLSDSKLLISRVLQEEGLLH